MYKNPTKNEGVVYTNGDANLKGLRYQVLASGSKVFVHFGVLAETALNVSKCAILCAIFAQNGSNRHKEGRNAP